MARHIDPALMGDYSAPATYQRLLKSRGLTDDVTYREICQMTVNTGKRVRIREEAIRRLTERLQESCVRAATLNRSPQTDRQRQLYHHVEQVFRRQ